MNAPVQHAQPLPTGWEVAVDPATGHPYYFNRASGATSWHPPDTAAQPTAEASAHVQPHDAGASQQEAVQPVLGEGAAASARGDGTHGELATAGATASGISRHCRTTGSGSSRDGWYYRDRSGKLHGPFEQAALQAWRSFLPMDLLVWYVELQPGGQPQRQEQPATAATQPEQQEQEQHGVTGSGGQQGQAHSRKRPLEELASDADGAAPEGRGTQRGEGEEAVPAEQRDPTAGSSGLGLEGYGDEPCAEDRSGEGEDGEGGAPTSSKVSVADGERRGEAEAAVSTSVAGQDQDGAVAEGLPFPKRQRCDSPSACHQEGARNAAATDEDAAPSARRSASPSPTPGGNATDMPPAGIDAADGEAGADGPVGQSNGPASAEEAIACGLPGIELAELLGDGALLVDWRQRFPGSRPPGTAPPAPVHDQWLRGMAASMAAAHHAQSHAGAQYGYGYGYGHGYGHGYGYGHGTAAAQGGSGEGEGEAAASRPRSREESMLEYAQAVLAGLPPDDEAVVLARQAAAAGRSLAEVVNFSWSSGSGAYGSNGGGDTASAPPPVDEHGVPTEYVRDPRSGRLTAVGKDAAPASAGKALYGEYGNWVDPDQIEDYLSKAKRWRQEQLPLLWSRKKQKEQRESKAKKAIKAMLL